MLSQSVVRAITPAAWAVKARKAARIEKVFSGNTSPIVPTDEVAHNGQMAEIQ
jgi:hypothetical protein